MIKGTADRMTPGVQQQSRDSHNIWYGTTEVGPTADGQLLAAGKR